TGGDDALFVKQVGRRGQHLPARLVASRGACAHGTLHYVLSGTVYRRLHRRSISGRARRVVLASWLDFPYGSGSFAGDARTRGRWNHRRFVPDGPSIVHGGVHGDGD